MLASWLAPSGALENEENLIFFHVALGYTAIEPGDLDAYETITNLDYDNTIFTDGDPATDAQYVLNQFMTNNPGESGQGMPMVFKRDMTIGIMSGKAEWDEYPLTEIQQYLSE